MPELLTPQEIVSNLRDEGLIGAAAAMQLEQRILAYGAKEREQGRIEGITATVKKGEGALYRVKGSGQRGGAEKILSAQRALLPAEVMTQQQIAEAQDKGYRRGFRDGQQSKTFTERNPRGIR